MPPRPSRLRDWWWWWWCTWCPCFRVLCCCWSCHTILLQKIVPSRPSKISTIRSIHDLLFLSLPPSRQESINCKFHVLDFCPLWLQHCMVATYIKSSYTKDHIPSPTVHNASVLRTAYEVHAFKKSWQMSHVVCTKQMVLAAFYNLLLVQVYPWNYSLYFRHACCLFSDRPSSACHSLG